MSEINLSFWNIERIQKEQDKHVTPYAINPIDKNRLDDAIMKDLSVVDSIDSEINKYMRKVQEQSDMYRICEIAKLYIESQRPAEWIEHEDERWGGVWYTCSNCHQYAPYKQDDYNIWRQKLSDFCPNCGRRMKNGC